MRRFWKRKRAAARSVATDLAPHGWPWITTTTPGRYAVSYANDVTRTSWVPHTTARNYSSGQSTISNNPLQERYSMTTRPYDSVSVEAIAADDASAAVVRYQGLEAYGSSKRNKHERKNADTGLDIAIGRAFKNLGRQMETRGLKRIGDV